MNSGLYPLRFEPFFRRYIWGGRRFGTLFGKPIGDGNDYAESWEFVDRGADQSRVAFGPLAGTSLGELVRERGHVLLGRHNPQHRFPLLIKLLDAQESFPCKCIPTMSKRLGLIRPISAKPRPGLCWRQSRAARSTPD